MTNASFILLLQFLALFSMILVSFFLFDDQIVRAILFATTYITFTFWSIAFWIVITLEERLPKHP